MSDNQPVIEASTHADFAAHVVWSDDSGAPMPVVNPSRCEVRDAADNIVITFDDGANAATAAKIAPSTASGIIQLTAPKTVTSSWPPGRYKFDIFVTVNSSSNPFATMYRPAITGWFVVNKAVTRGNP